MYFDSGKPLDDAVPIGCLFDGFEYLPNEKKEFQDWFKSVFNEDVKINLLFDEELV